ncbi:MAG: hypothetical protein IKB61_04540, partial [Elusimicrobiaceae bacterium]|nr:hypothetical protein [Elusimicrobiaceae bacterium]
RTCINFSHIHNLSVKCDKAGPFLNNGQDERFQFSFAVGACGGLLFSIIALIFVVPVFVGMRTVNGER